MYIAPKPLSGYPWWLRPLFWLQRRRYGQPLVPSLLWARQPRLFLAVALMYGMLDSKRSPLEPVLRSLVLVRVSQINWCPFCIDINSATLIARAGSREKVDSLAGWRDSLLFSERERAALEYCELVTPPGSAVPEPVMTRLLAFFGEEGVIELTGLIAFQNLSTKFNSALAVSPQGFCQVAAPAAEGA